MYVRIGIYAFACFVFVLAFSGPATSQDEGAKALFFGDTVKETAQIKQTASGTAGFSGTEVQTETIAPNKKIAGPVSVSKKKAIKATGTLATGLSYWIEVIRPDGRVERCTAENRVFRSGERIRFAFKTNKEGYLYLLLIGSSGKGRTLFPDVRINEGKNLVAMNADYRIPFGEKSFVMDATPGQETILVFFSQSELADINNYFIPKGQVEAQDTKRIYAFAQSNGSKDIAFEEYKGSKDVFFEDDVAEASLRPASYIVSTSSDPKNVLFKEIKLRHK